MVQGLSPQNSLYTVNGIGVYLNKSQIWVAWYRPVHSKFVIPSTWKRSVFKYISDLDGMAQACALKIRHIQYMEKVCI